MYGPLLYTAYRTHRTLTGPVYATTELTSRAARVLPTQLRRSKPVRRAMALSEVVYGARLTHSRPAFGVDEVETGPDGSRTAVSEHPVDGTPFGTLIHFAKAEGPTGPPLLLVAPLSGHFSTMLRATISRLLHDHDVYVTDWHNARDVPLSAGPFGMDEYVDHLVRYLRHLGPGSHMVAVCQPCVPALAAVAVLAAADDPCQPRSLTLMSGPIDTRAAPTKVNDSAVTRPLSWYRANCITTVPSRFHGAGRRVYPGFLQLSAFLSMNLGRHLRSHTKMYRDLMAGDVAGAAAGRAFYDEYFAVLDMPEEFYLDTVSQVFQEHLLARGEMTFRGEPVDPTAIRATRLLTVEAELDDMCAPGQTAAAHELCTSLSDEQRGRHLQPGVGHYGVFAGKRWENEIYPVIRDFVARS